MSARGNGNVAPSIRRTRKKLYARAKSWMAVVLSVAMLLTSVDGMTVRAAGPEDMVPPAAEEGNPETPVLPEASEKPPYLINEEGAVIISSFKVLPEEEARIELEERKTLEEVRELMPETLTAKVTPAPLTDADQGQTGEDEADPDEGDANPDEGDANPGEEEKPGEEGNPGEGEGNSGEEEPGEGEDNPGEEEPGEGEGTPGGEEPGEGDSTPGGEEPGEGDSNPGGEEEPGEGDGNPEGELGEGDSVPGEEGEPGEGDSVLGEETAPNEEERPEGETDGEGGAESRDAADCVDDVACAARSEAVSLQQIQDGKSWRLLVEAGESEGGSAGGENGSGLDEETKGGSEGEPGSDNGEEGSRGDGAGGTGDDGADGTGDADGSGDNNTGDGTDGSDDGADGTGSTGGSGDNAGAGAGGTGEDGAGGTGSTGGSGDNAGDGTDGSEDGADGTGSTDGNGDGGTGDGGTDGAGSIEDGDTAGGDGADTPGAGEGENPPGTETDGEQTKTAEVEVPVTWECENYDAEEADTYTFVPKWDEKEWFFEEDGEHKLPTVEVVYTGTGPEVSTEGELAAAFEAGFERVTLKNDISLTTTLTLPADADIELDGGGYRLTRGNAAEGEEESGSAGTFLGTMIAMDGEDYTEDTYGKLTLKNLTVDGATEADRAGAPAILDRGSLVLDEGACVTDNFNYGTYPGEEDGEAETVLDYGGGIQVYGELTVSPEALITGNFADEFGGGVYLAEGASLYLYADMIVENSVGEGHGYGADLYAAPGSTVYYDPSIDMGREGFYICEGAYLVPMGAARTDLPVDERKEVYISVAEDSGYDKAYVEALKAGLQELGYTIITDRRTDIDATDLRDWYVYDHYDTDANCWGPGTADNPPAAWTEAYKDSGDKRKYYPYTETKHYRGSGQVYTVKDWLRVLEDSENPAYNQYVLWTIYRGDDGEEVKVKTRKLASFKEHIYSGSGSEGAMMTFAGYGITPNIDFLYYDPESDGEKVVDFDVDSSQIDTHTLTGNGFLVNTGVEEGKLYGYLVLYRYQNILKKMIIRGQEVYVPAGVRGASVILYQLKGVPVDDFHNGLGSYLGSTSAPQIKYTIIEEKDWDNMMSVQIKASPEVIEVRHQPKSSAGDISASTPVLTYDLKKNNEGSQENQGEENGKTYSGFGPLVAYGSHNCYSATMFTYSNLRMYYTNPELEKEDMLSPLEKADFTQEGTQKYFINLFGDSDLAYNETASFGQYQEYMKMMQNEGIALITDRETPFGPYLGEADDPGSNLVELAHGGGRPPVDDLIRKIHEGISGKTTTRLDDKLDLPPEAGGVAKPKPGQSVGNIWLKSAAGGGQIRETLQGDSFGDGGYGIRIMDDITYYHGNQADLTVKYEVLKPGRNGYTTLCTVNGGDAAAYSMGETDDGVRITPPPFTVTKNAGEWPTGSYTVRQTINNSAIHGYAYFDLEQPYTPDTPDPVPDTYPVKVKVPVRLNNEAWTGHGRKFMLRPEGGGTPIDPTLWTVPAGTYVIDDVTGSEEGVSTGVTVSVANVDTPNTEVETEPVDYYSVTFYDENTDDKKPCESGEEPNPQIVLKGGCAQEPAFTPTKDKRKFAGWVTGTGEAFDFGSQINGQTEVYAKWQYPATVKVTATRDGEEWQGHGKTFMLRPEDGGALAGLSDVPEGKYTVCEVEETAEDGSLKKGVDTGIPVEVTYGELPNQVEVEVPYYTVTFYKAYPDGEKYGDDTAQAGRTVLEGEKITPPAAPQKDKYNFMGWVSDDGTEGGKPFDFDQTAVLGRVELYATWEKIPDPSYQVTVQARIDGAAWENAGRTFALRPEGGEGETVFLPARVKKGTYRIYDITPAPYGARAVGADADVVVEDGDTGVTITVDDKDVAAYAEYYRVTFYDGKAAYGTDTDQRQIVVLGGKKAKEPPAPEKKGHRFTGWKTAEGGEAAYDFKQAVSRKTDLYAGWEVITYTIDAAAGRGGRISPSGKVTVNAGEQQTFTVKPDRGNHVKSVKVDETDVTAPVIKAKGFYTFTDVYEDHTITAAFEADKEAPGKGREPEEGGGNGEGPQTVTVRQDGAPAAGQASLVPGPVPEERMPGEPKTADATPVEIYATVAMVAGMTYLHLYFMEAGRGMTEREKEVFVAAFIRWAKKGGRFRRCCAIVAIFCILVYYHSIGKRAGRKNLNKKELLYLWK